MASQSQSEKKTVSSVAFIKRKPGLTPEEFYHHWENIHGPLVKPWVKKHGFISYTQVQIIQFCINPSALLLQS
jgi:hypothetical protein